MLNLCKQLFAGQNAQQPNLATFDIDGFEGTVSVGGRSITNLRFADDTDLVGGNAEKLIDLTSRIEECAKRFGMQASAKKKQSGEDGNH